MDTEIVKIAHLKGADNWAPWKFQIRVILNAAGAWKVVNGDETKLAAAAPAAGTSTAALEIHEGKLAAWEKADRTGQKVIGTTVGPQTLLHIINCESAAEMWNKLKSVYEQKSEVSTHMLQQQWYSATMGPKDSISSYIAKLEDIAHKLDVMGEKVSDNMIMTKILMTLPQGYAHFVSVWESTALAERTLANLTCRFTIEEMRHGIGENAEGSALAANREETRQKQKSRKRFTKAG